MTNLIIFIRSIPLFLVALVYRALHEFGIEWNWAFRWVYSQMQKVEDYEARQKARQQAVELIKRTGGLNRAQRRARP